MINYTNAEKCLLLQRIPLFRELEADDLEHLAKFAKTQSYKAREVIFNQADSGHQMAIIIRGQVKLSILSGEGKEMTLAMPGVGDILGEMALLDGLGRSATVIAKEPTLLLVIQRQDFIPFLEEYPQVAIKMLTTLAGRLRVTDETFEDTLFRNLSARLAKKLLMLADSYGQPVPEGTRIQLKFSQTELGHMIGTSRESVNKQLRTWEGEGLVSCDNGSITLTNSTALGAFL